MNRAWFVLLLAACTTGSSNTIAGATTTTALALGAAAVSRSNGGCVAICTNGTTCNPRSGLCEQLPCRGRCGADEHCETSFSESKCMPGAAGVVTEAKTAPPKIPVVAPIPTAPDANHASPSITPAAQQDQNVPK